MSYYGAISEDMVARKYEETSLYEDPFQVEDHMRSELSDFRPDQAVLESDLPRRDYQSTSRINLRIQGSRGDFPEHPEMFIGFMDRDPRSTFDDPDFKQMNNQSWAVNALGATMYNDDDLSVPSQGIRPEKMYHQIRQSQGELKRRWKIFSTSKDALKPGMSPMAHSLVSDIDKTYSESERMDQHLPEDLTFRQSHTAKMSNDTNIGWWSTTDNEFKVGAYGENPKMPGRQHSGVKRDTRYEQEFRESYKTKPTMAMTMLMSAAVSGKKVKHKEGDMAFHEGMSSTSRKTKNPATSHELMNLMHQAINQIKYGDSNDPMNKKSKKMTDVKKVQQFVDMTQKLPMHTQMAIKDELERFVAKNPTMHDLHPDRSKVVINPKLLTFMDDHIRKSAKKNPTKIGAHMADRLNNGEFTIQEQKNGPDNKWHACIHD